MYLRSACVVAVVDRPAAARRGRRVRCGCCGARHSRDSSPNARGPCGRAVSGGPKRPQSLQGSAGRPAIRRRKGKVGSGDVLDLAPVAPVALSLSTCPAGSWGAPPCPGAAPTTFAPNTPTPRHATARCDKPPNPPRCLHSHPESANICVSTLRSRVTTEGSAPVIEVRNGREGTGPARTVRRGRSAAHPNHTHPKGSQSRWRRSSLSTRKLAGRWSGE